MCVLLCFTFFLFSLGVEYESQSSGHELGGNKTPSPQGAKGKDAMEIDDNDLGHLSYGIELDDIDDDLPNSITVRDVTGDKGTEALGTH